MVVYILNVEIKIRNWIIALKELNQEYRATLYDCKTT